MWLLCFKGNLPKPKRGKGFYRVSQKTIAGHLLQTRGLSSSGPAEGNPRSTRRRPGGAEHPTLQGKAFRLRWVLLGMLARQSPWLNGPSKPGGVPFPLRCVRIISRSHVNAFGGSRKGDLHFEVVPWIPQWTDQRPNSKQGRTGPPNKFQLLPSGFGPLSVPHMSAFSHHSTQRKL